MATVFQHAVGRFAGVAIYENERAIAARGSGKSTKADTPSQTKASWTLYLAAFARDAAAARLNTPRSSCAPIRRGLSARSAKDDTSSVLTVVLVVDVAANRAMPADIVRQFGFDAVEAEALDKAARLDQHGEAWD